MARYHLPDLSFDYSALEPHVAGRIMELHHGAHHAAYVKNANAALEAIEEARNADDFAAVPALERKLAFHLSGHILHSIFWTNLSPEGGGEPSGDLADAITDSFGGFDAFREQMVETAESIMGSGWAALVWEPLGSRLLATQVHDHQSNVVQAAAPIMVIDAWEHAYYLQYENRKRDFFTALWNVWTWDDIAARFELARATDAHLPAGKHTDSAP
jgi:Fe-Mn family superoxide dismutase